MSPETARRLSLGFNGLAADWYWLNALQYIGRKLEEQTPRGQEVAQAAELDRLKALDPRVLVRLFDMISTLDPRFTAVYEFAAVVLPVVDVPAAVALLEKGIQTNPDQWYLHQQLAYIYWQRGDYLAAADAFRRGARMTTARWMEFMAKNMEAKGDDPQVARAMYSRMYEQAQDDQVKQWALKRLMELRSLEERAQIRRVLAVFVAAQAHCPGAWGDLTAPLRAAALRTDGRGQPLDPSDTPYLLVVRPLGCDVTLHPPPRCPRMSAIEIEGLSKDYPTGFLHLKRVRVLDNLSLTVERGEIFGFLGGNGAGKTTTIKILMRLMTQTAGVVRILGHDSNARWVRARIGYLPEHPYFYDYLTARELIEYYAELFGYSRAARRARAVELLRRVHLDEAAWNRQLRKFSKGMLQRVGLAQALVNDPELVVLDEPMSGLDPIGRRQVRDLIAGLRDTGVTVFFSSHLVADIEVLCDRVAILQKGRLAHLGRLEELRSREDSGGHLEITVEGGGAGLEDALRKVEGALVTATPAGAHRRAAGSMVDQALRPPRTCGARLVSVQPVRQSLEELFVSRRTGAARRLTPPPCIRTPPRSPRDRSVATGCSSSTTSRSSSRCSPSTSRATTTWRPR